MKYLFGIITALLFLTISNPLQAQTDHDAVEVKVDGLGCPFCAYGLEKKFKEFEGIDNVNIEMETGIFTFSYPADKSLTIEAIEKQVEAAGYTPVYAKVQRADGTFETSEATVEEISHDAVLEEVQLFVAGNCNMCKARIEKSALDAPGVSAAEWNKATQFLSLTFDSQQISAEQVAVLIAASGHDTKSTKASQEIYDKLPGCCQYDRASDNQ